MSGQLFFHTIQIQTKYNHKNCIPYVVHSNRRDSPYVLLLNVRTVLMLCILDVGTFPGLCILNSGNVSTFNIIEVIRDSEVIQGQ